MTGNNITSFRLDNQQISSTQFSEPQEIVHWMIAMQAQEYAMAKWAVGLRLPGVDDAAVEKAFNVGRVLRTHLMRPTWHFVSPADIRWLLALTAPRVQAANAYWYRKFELDEATITRSNDILIKALEGGKHLTRTALKSILEREKIRADGLRLSYLMMQAELDGILCSGPRQGGPRQGKQFTYALLDERVPPTRVLDREEALVCFTRRYFASRGPATLQDFSYWSGLTLKDAKAGAASLKSELVNERIDGRECLFLPTETVPKTPLSATFLMPDYDEYGMSYKNRAALVNPLVTAADQQRLNPAFNQMIVVNGRISGRWRRTLKNNSMVVETSLSSSLTPADREGIKVAIQRYYSFSGTTVEEL